MDPKDKLEAAVRKAKIEWRRVVDSPKSTPYEKSRALADWKEATANLDLALALMRRNLVERRKPDSDRRKANVIGSWVKVHGDRRLMKRRP